MGGLVMLYFLWQWLKGGSGTSPPWPAAKKAPQKRRVVHRVVHHPAPHGPTHRRPAARHETAPVHPAHKKAKETPPVHHEEAYKTPVDTHPARIHIVQAGESPWRIAHYFVPGNEGQGVRDLDAANPEKRPRITQNVWTGEKLRLPEGWPDVPHR